MNKVFLIASLLVATAFFDASAQHKPKQVKIMGYPAQITSQGTIICGQDHSQICVKITIGSKLIENSDDFIDNEVLEGYSKKEEDDEMWLSVFTGRNSIIEFPIKEYFINKNSQNRTEIRFK